MTLPKIAIIHSVPKLGGGPEAITMNVIEALREKYALSLITYSPIDFAAFNEFYGTSVGPRDVNIVRLCPPPIKRGSFLRGYRISRYCQKVAWQYDVLFSIYNGMDFKHKGIQYMIDPSFSAHLLQQLNPLARDRWIYQDNLFRRLYIMLGNMLSGTSLKGLANNVSIADSIWTAQLAKQYIGVDCKVIYPPVRRNDNRLPFEAREDGFVTVGRISPDKNLEKVVAILKQVRIKYPKLHLHIIGRTWTPTYSSQLEEYYKDQRDWIYFEKDISDQKKRALLGLHKYGIHGKDYEPFGIGIAEMVLSECLVWVPSGGGQVEIVSHPDLIYNDAKDAELKIKRVLSDDSLRLALRSHLLEQAKLFSIAKFRSEIRDLFRVFLEQNRRQ